MEEFLTRELNSPYVKKSGVEGGGCINQCQRYETDRGKIFVKFNKGHWARDMFEGEVVGLQAIEATQTIRVPKPIKILDAPISGAMLAMEYLDISDLDKYSAQLGKQIARLHLHNNKQSRKAAKQANSIHKDDTLHYVDQFGFDVTTFCGRVPNHNTWQDDWAFNDREMKNLWGLLLPKIPGYFKGLSITPSLLHGDLHVGNTAEMNDGSNTVTVIYDPGSFYGHHGFELSIAMKIGGFPPSFYDSYFNIIPKTRGFSTRNKLYQLFHYLNAWNHFGIERRESTKRLLEDCLKTGP